MHDDSPDPWRLPALERFGEQLGARRPEPRRDPGRLAGAATAIAMIAVAVAAGLLLRGGAARASSVINRAPAAAVRSRSVRFSSRIEVTGAGGTSRRFNQTGAIDFARGSYRTVLTAEGAHSRYELVSIDGILYSHYAGLGAERSGWAAVALSARERKQLASTPESDALTDPLALLRILQRTKARVQYLYRTIVETASVDCYAFSNTLEELLALSDPARRASAGGRGARGSFTVCLDGAGRPRAVEEQLASGHAKLTANLAFSGYAVPSAIAAPRDARLQSRRIATPQPLFGAPTRIFERLLGIASR